jgi:hypothetical protein
MRSSRGIYPPNVRLVLKNAAGSRIVVVVVSSPMGRLRAGRRSFGIGRACRSSGHNVPNSERRSMIRPPNRKGSFRGAKLAVPRVQESVHPRGARVSAACQCRRELGCSVEVNRSAALRMNSSRDRDESQEVSSRYGVRGTLRLLLFEPGRWGAVQSEARSKCSRTAEKSSSDQHVGVFLDRAALGRCGV